MLVNLLNSMSSPGLGKGVSQVHRGRYYVAVRRNGEDVKRDISISIERLFHADSLKIVLWDEEEPTFLCVVRVTRADYEELKKQQGLLIDFDNFPSQLVRLLQQCAATNMFLILQQSDPRQFYLEVVEHNEFKRLVHLSLKTMPATDADVQAHMADTIVNLKKTLATAKNASTSSEIAWGDKCSELQKKIQDLTFTLARTEEDRQRREVEHQDLIKIERERLNQERMEWQRSMEHTSQTHASSLQDAVTRKEKQLDEMNTKCRQLKDNVHSLEGQLNDKLQRMGLLEKEVQKSHIEVATLRAKNTTLDRDCIEKDRHMHQWQSKCTELEKSLKDTQEHVKEMKSNIQALQREKMNLEQKLSLSESLLDKSNQALQSTSEQLLKANQIISKQNADVIELKEKMLCRTAIVIEQEKVIERSSQDMEALKKCEEEVRSECVRLRAEGGEMATRLSDLEKGLKEKEETIKNNNMVIQWLHKKMEELNPQTEPLWNIDSKRPETANTRTSSNGYFSEALETISEDPCPSTRRTQDSNSSGTGLPKKSLDPRYLRPADDEKGSTKRTEPRGKENLTANLPRVVYHPKKSARSVSYKATPASAYFTGK